MHLPAIDPTTLGILLAIPGAITAVASITNFLYKILKPKKTTTQLQQPAPPGYYRRRILYTLLYTLLAIYSAFIALIYSGQQNIFTTTLFYTFIISTILCTLMIPLSIYIMIKKL